MVHWIHGITNVKTEQVGASAWIAMGGHGILQHEPGDYTVVGVGRLTDEQKAQFQRYVIQYAQQFGADVKRIRFRFE